ncbi:MAG: hypothetical protein BECKG1743F_GA0114225_108391, partial [Candidatus Kentron sp. G]
MGNLAGIDCRFFGSVPIRLFSKKLFGNSQSTAVAPELRPCVTAGAKIASCSSLQSLGTPLLRPSKFEGHCPMIRHGCRMALMVALNWSVECVKEE